MEFIDTHTHLFSKEFDDDISDVIENAIKIAVNDALEDAKDTSAKKLKAVTGGLTDGLPGF